MAVTITNTNYTGEVLERILTVAATGNELVEKGLIHVEPNVSKKFSIPRIKAGTMLQKRKENPTVADSKGDFSYDEKVLEPKDFMAFTTFNPRTFEAIWRKWQPKGQLVFAELPGEAQNALLEAMSKQVTFELGELYVNGRYGTTDTQLFNGIISRILSDKEVINVTTTETTMVNQLKALQEKIPVTLRNNPRLCIICSVKDGDTYDNELKAQNYKSADWTSTNPMRFGNIPMKTLSAWPDGLLVATLCSMDYDGNLFAAVNLQDDESVIQMEKVAPMSELYFFKMLMKADTNIAFGEECVVLDKRETTAATLTGTVITPTGYANSYAETVTADKTYTIGTTDMELGATIDVSNTATGAYKITVGTTVVAKGKTVRFVYTGTAWEAVA